MAEATRPGEGGNNCYGSMPELKERKSVSGAFAGATTGTKVIFVDPNHDAYIPSVRVRYHVDASGTAGSLSVGIAGSTAALVSAHTVAATETAGTVDECTLVTTNYSTAGQATGFYKVPAGTPLIATYTTGGANNVAFDVECNYVLLDKGI